MAGHIQYQLPGRLDGVTGDGRNVRSKGIISRDLGFNQSWIFHDTVLTVFIGSASYMPDDLWMKPPYAYKHKNFCGYFAKVLGLLHCVQHYFC